jgi:hypothetical protein
VHYIEELRCDLGQGEGRPRLARVLVEPASFPSRVASISQRLKAVEEVLESTNDRLARLGARLTGLEKHVGVNCTETRGCANGFWHSLAKTVAGV